MRHGHFRFAVEREYVVPLQTEMRFKVHVGKIQAVQVANKYIGTLAVIRHKRYTIAVLESKIRQAVRLILGFVAYLGSIVEYGYRTEIAAVGSHIYAEFTVYRLHFKLADPIGRGKMRSVAVALAALFSRGAVIQNGAVRLRSAVEIGRAVVILHDRARGRVTGHSFPFNGSRSLVIELHFEIFSGVLRVGKADSKESLPTFYDDKAIHKREVAGKYAVYCRIVSACVCYK